MNPYTLAGLLPHARNPDYYGFVPWTEKLKIGGRLCFVRIADTKTLLQPAIVVHVPMTCSRVLPSGTCSRVLPHVLRKVTKDIGRP